MKLTRFRRKKIAILGLSVEGIETVKFFSNKKIPVAVFDQKKEKQFNQELIGFLIKNNIKYYLGENYFTKLSLYDLVVRTPGFPLWHNIFKILRARGIEISSHIKIFFQLCPGKIIGVTGTKGKGTTTTLIYQILKEAKKEVFIGGNIGIGPLSFLDKLTPSAFVVLELSSFQLEDITVSPHIAVILNVTADHLFSASKDSPNYHRSVKEYIQAKNNLVRFQTNKDYAVINYDYQSSRQFSRFSPARKIYFSKNKKLDEGSYVFKDKIYLKRNGQNFYICNRTQILLKGEHNLENITAAVATASLTGAAVKDMAKVIKNFPGLEHRLELVRLYKNIQFYNDSFSTTPETTIAAIRSFNQPIVLICGGSEKGSDYTLLGKEIVKGKVKNLILVGHTAPKIKLAVENASRILMKKVPITDYQGKSMAGIVETAFSQAAAGDIILLSPACASFDMFKNYKERGDLFKRAVKNI